MTQLVKHSFILQVEGTELGPQSTDTVAHTEPQQWQGGWIPEAHRPASLLDDFAG